MINKNAKKGGGTIQKVEYLRKCIKNKVVFWVGDCLDFGQNKMLLLMIIGLKNFEIFMRFWE